MGAKGFENEKAFLYIKSTMGRFLIFTQNLPSPPSLFLLHHSSFPRPNCNPAALFLGLDTKPFIFFPFFLFSFPQRIDMVPYFFVWTAQGKEDSSRT
jgi:hypothetical protein